jgi:hypothetical protein
MYYHVSILRYSCFWALIFLLLQTLALRKINTYFYHGVFYSIPTLCIAVYFITIYSMIQYVCVIEAYISKHIYVWHAWCSGTARDRGATS